MTILGGYEAGTPVNLEVDLIARYVERMREVESGQ
jgi:riboflavin synthase alpha subunit